MKKFIKLITVTSLSTLVSIVVNADDTKAPAVTVDEPGKVEATVKNKSQNIPAQNNKTYPPQATNQTIPNQGQRPMMDGRGPQGGMHMPMMRGHQGNMPMMGNQQRAMQMPMMRGPQGSMPMMIQPQANMPMMGNQQNRLSMKQLKKMNKRKMRQQKQAMKKAQMKKMETHLENIEALLKELVELQKNKK